MVCFFFIPEVKIEPSVVYSHGSQTMRRDALVRRFNFPRASHKIIFSAVLFNELTRVKISAVLLLYPRTIILLKSDHARCCFVH